MVSHNGERGGRPVHQVLVNGEPAELRPDGEFSAWV